MIFGFPTRISTSLTCQFVQKFPQSKFKKSQNESSFSKTKTIHATRLSFTVRFILLKLSGLDTCINFLFTFSLTFTFIYILVYIYIYLFTFSLTFTFIFTFVYVIINIYLYVYVIYILVNIYILCLLYKIYVCFVLVDFTLVEIWFWSKCSHYITLFFLENFDIIFGTPKSDKLYNLSSKTQGTLLNDLNK